MRTSTRSARRYGARVALTAAAIALLSGASLAMLFGNGLRGVAFGNPFARWELPAEPMGPPAPVPPAAGGPAAEAPAPDADPPAAESTAASRTAEDEPREAPAPLPDGGGAATSPLALARAHVERSEWDAALRIYGRLHLARPDDRALAIERARVLAWSGDPGAGAAALQLVLRGPADADDAARLRIEQARFLWWAGEHGPADAALAQVVASQGSSPQVDSLRTAIRGGAAPDVALAERWLATRPGPLEHLLLGRALALTGREGSAIPHYRAFLRAEPAADSVMLEMAAVAGRADSLDAATAVLRDYLGRRPDDQAARLRLARHLAWSGHSDPARVEYRRVVDATGDPDARFELAQLEAWAGELDAAERELGEVLARRPRHAGALKLGGDIALWRGEWRVALELYAAAGAADPRLERLDEAVREAERQRAAAALASLAPGGWGASAQGFADNDGFRWLATRATRTWRGAATFVELTVEHTGWEGRGHARAAQPGTGYGFELGAGTHLAERLWMRAHAGARSLGDGFRPAVWGAELGFDAATAGRVGLGVERQPALRRSAALAALEAEVLSDLLHLTGSWPMLGFDWWARAEAERLSSDLGTNRRFGGTLAASRALGGGLAATAAAGGLLTDAPSPVLPEWGALYWSPEHYASASVGLAYRRAMPPTGYLALRAAPGYVWVREREIGDGRYPRARLPVLGAGVEAGYPLRGWLLSAGADWNGSLEQGYRAAALRLQISQAVSLP